MTAWQIDVSKWPGPDRGQFSLHDIVEPSPDARFAAVLYSCGEIGVMKEVGNFALLEGPPERPTLVLRPPRLTCMVWHNGRSIEWVCGSRYCVVTACSLDDQVRPKGFCGRVLFDVRQSAVALESGVSSADDMREIPGGLEWRPWTWLSRWHELRYEL